MIFVRRERRDSDIDPTPYAHIDNAGMLRDIFAAMFPDLGDVQLERIRSAIRESYNRLGWGKDSESPREVPEFRTFYELLQQDAKGNQNVLVRLNELSEYGVFEMRVAERLAYSERSLLATSTPSVLRIHATQNDGVQRAVAMLVLYNIDKEMFRRGVQSRITHAVVFDEAHRASRLGPAQKYCPMSLNSPEFRSEVWRLRLRQLLMRRS